MPLVLESPCKINLLLNVLGRRPDGFHELETLLHPVPLCDTLAFYQASGESGVVAQVQLNCSEPALPADAGNLVHRAASAFLHACGIREAVRIHLEKRIPLAAGLGGGSGNAATTLLGLNTLFGGPLTAVQLQTLATALGSDVPFFLQSRPALATGRGETVVPLDTFTALHGVHVLLIHPGFGVSTPWAYQNLARFPDALNGRPGRARRLATLLQGRDLRLAAADFYNSLEAPVLEKYPVLGLYQEFLSRHGALAARMSGSGSTTFALVENAEKGRQLETRFKTRFGDRCWTAVVPLRTQAG